MGLRWVKLSVWAGLFGFSAALGSPALALPIPPLKSMICTTLLEQLAEVPVLDRAKTTAEAREVFSRFRRDQLRIVQTEPSHQITRHIQLDPTMDASAPAQAIAARIEGIEKDLYFNPTASSIDPQDGDQWPTIFLGQTFRGKEAIAALLTDVGESANAMTKIAVGPGQFRNTIIRKVLFKAVLNLAFASYWSYGLIHLPPNAPNLMFPIYSLLIANDAWDFYQRFYRPMTTWFDLRLTSDTNKWNEIANQKQPGTWAYDSFEALQLRAAYRLMLEHKFLSLLDEEQRAVILKLTADHDTLSRKQNDPRNTHLIVDRLLWIDPETNEPVLSVMTRAYSKKPEFPNKPKEKKRMLDALRIF